MTAQILSRRPWHLALIILVGSALIWYASVDAGAQESTDSPAEPTPIATSDAPLSGEAPCQTSLSERFSTEKLAQSKAAASDPALATAKFASVEDGVTVTIGKSGKVKFSYVTNDTVACDAQGMPLQNGVVSVFHNDALTTGNFFPVNTDTNPGGDPPRANDWGPESIGAGMYPLVRARIQLSEHTLPGETNYHSVPGLTHELGHAAGLADLYTTANGCTNDNHGTTSVMACFANLDPIPGFDQTNLLSLYQRIPQGIPVTGNPPQAPNFRTTGATTTSISLAWTDYSFNEKDQIVTRTSDNATQIAPRDAQSHTWTGLSSGTEYCFNIKQRNAYGGTAAASPPVCRFTTAVPPANPSNVRVCSVPCDLYGFKDNATNEIGFGVIVQKRTTCSSGTWTQVGSNILLPPKNQTDDAYAYNFVGPGCFRVKVQALGVNGVHSGVVTSSPGIHFPN